MAEKTTLKIEGGGGASGQSDAVEIESSYVQSSISERKLKELKERQDAEKRILQARDDFEIRTVKEQESLKNILSEKTSKLQEVLSSSKVKVESIDTVVNRIDNFMQSHTRLEHRGTFQITCKSNKLAIIKVPWKGGGAPLSNPLGPSGTKASKTQSSLPHVLLTHRFLGTVEVIRSLVYEFRLIDVTDKLLHIEIDNASNVDIDALVYWQVTENGW
jgi:hypothetical protein